MKVHQSHPQLQKVEVVHTAYIFECPGCGEEFYVRAAWVQPDGSLKCPRCDDTTRTRSFRWCPLCQQAKPWREFERDPRDHHPRCLDCASAGTQAPPQPKTCDHCGTEFTPTRTDARFCSGRCRIAAHRQITQA
jgi:hypothetical protein